MPQVRAPNPRAARPESLDLLTLKEAAGLVNKTPSNISYLLQYRRLNKYDPTGIRVSRAPSGGLRVSRAELLAYFSSVAEKQSQRLRSLSIAETDLAFFDVPERERTKHVHRLHPYLGKFIPQLTEYFLRRYFEPGDSVIDPFCGSGTTLVQAAEMGINSIGVDVSEFNVMISRVKLARYDLALLQEEVDDALRRTADYSREELSGMSSLSREDSERVGVQSDYLKTWFAERSLREMVFYRDLIPRYRYQDLLKVLLSRAVRSCRLTYHYELATPRRPVRAPYRCHKHSKTCTPVSTVVPRLRLYSRDAVRRIAAFASARKECESAVIRGDSRAVDFIREADGALGPGWLAAHRARGIFTSPPYIGQIDYHDQHMYAYELFGIERRDEFEIGAKADGKGARAQEDYIEGISEVLSNVKHGLAEDAVFLIVANDRLRLYPAILRKAGLRVAQTFQRPVEDRTERDKRPYSETVFLGRQGPT